MPGQYTYSTRDIKNICIIGGGVVETDGKSYFCKASIAEYLHDLAKITNNRIDFVTSIEDTHNYVSHIDINRVNVIVQGNSRQNATLLDVLFDFKSQFQLLRKLLNQQTGVILCGLTIGRLGTMVITKIFAGRVIYYLGSDPQLMAKLKPNTFKGTLKRFGLACTFPLTAFLSDGVLARGNACYIQSQRWNKNVILSQPQILYSQFKNHTQSPNIDTTNTIVRFLYVGKLDKNKGVHLLLQAVSRLINIDQRDIQLTILGSGPEVGNLKKIVHEQKISKNVDFTGYIDKPEQLLTFYTRSDIIIIPTVTAEGFPRVIDEAMACGKPVVCSRLGGMATSLNDDEVIFVEPGSADDLYKALYLFITDKKLHNELKMKSLIRAEKILFISAAKQHSQFLLGVLG